MDNKFAFKCETCKNTLLARTFELEDHMINVHFNDSILFLDCELKKLNDQPIKCMADEKKLGCTFEVLSVKGTKLVESIKSTSTLEPYNIGFKVFKIIVFLNINLILYFIELQKFLLYECTSSGNVGSAHATQ